MTKTMGTMVLVLGMTACLESSPEEPDAAVTADAPAVVPAWRALECRWLCGDPTANSPALCAGAQPVDCMSECRAMSPAAAYCPQPH